MKLKTMAENKPSNPRNKFTAVAVLIGGVAILPNCISNVPPSQTEHQFQSVQASSLLSNPRNSSQGTRADEAAGDLDAQREISRRMLEAGREAGLEPSMLESIANVQFETSRQTVMVGSAVRFGCDYEGSLHFMNVTGIDSNGVDFGEYGRVEYSRPRYIGEFVITMQISAEPGPDGTAMISTTYPVFEIKRTRSERINPPAPAHPAVEYQTSGPVQK